MCVLLCVCGVNESSCVWPRVCLTLKMSSSLNTHRTSDEYERGIAVHCSVLQCVAVCRSVSQCVAVCCSVSQCVAVCRSVLPCVAVLTSAPATTKCLSSIESIFDQDETSDPEGSTLSPTHTHLFTHTHTHITPC